MNKGRVDRRASKTDDNQTGQCQSIPFDWHRNQKRASYRRKNTCSDHTLIPCPVGNKAAEETAKRYSKKKSEAKPAATSALIPRYCTR